MPEDQKRESLVTPLIELLEGGPANDGSGVVAICLTSESETASLYFPRALAEKMILFLQESVASADRIRHEAGEQIMGRSAVAGSDMYDATTVNFQVSPDGSEVILAFSGTTAPPRNIRMNATALEEMTEFCKRTADLAKSLRSKRGH